jgi:hypothetical protein
VKHFQELNNSLEQDLRESALRHQHVEVGDVMPFWPLPRRRLWSGLVTSCHFGPCHAGACGLAW